MCDIRPCIADVSIHFSHDSDMLIAVEKRVFLIFNTAVPATMRCLVGLKACVRKHDDQSLSIFVIGG